MGLLVDGEWRDQWRDTASTGGRFVRSTSQFRHFVTPDGAPGPSGSGGFAARAGRYHLYVSLACPWAHRTLIFRALKGLDRMIDVSVVHYLMAENGWTFSTDDPSGRATGDRLSGRRYVHQLYTDADPHYSGRVTVPVLWDTERETIVSNESSEIIRAFNSAFDDIGAAPGDYYPADLREEIDRINAKVYDQLNNGVYKAGFATSQEAYEEAADQLFDCLDWLEQLLGERRYLAGDRITEADWRAFTTLVRFDPVYVGHFKCNLRRLVDYPRLWAYTRELHSVPGVAETVCLDHIKRHYYMSHASINPSGVVPVGPAIDYASPQGR